MNTYQRLRDEGSTDYFSTKDILRLIQSIPSSRAEPFKVGMAQVAAQCVEQAIDYIQSPEELPLKKR